MSVISTEVQLDPTSPKLAPPSLGPPDTGALAADDSRHSTPELIIADIQLADGLSLEISDHAAPGCPVIFATAAARGLI